MCVQCLQSHKHKHKLTSTNLRSTEIRWEWFLVFGLFRSHRLQTYAFRRAPSPHLSPPTSSTLPTHPAGTSRGSEGKRPRARETTMDDVVVPATVPVGPAAGAAGGQAQPQNQEEKPGVAQLIMKVCEGRSPTSKAGRSLPAPDPVVPGAEPVVPDRDGRGESGVGWRCSCAAWCCALSALRGDYACDCCGVSLSRLALPKPPPGYDVIRTSS